MHVDILKSDWELTLGEGDTLIFISVFPVTALHWDDREVMLNTSIWRNEHIYGGFQSLSFKCVLWLQNGNCDWFLTAVSFYFHTTDSFAWLIELWLFLHNNCSNNVNI